MRPKRRIYDYITVNGVKLLTLFDTGARNSYITRNGVKKTDIKSNSVANPFNIGLGGKQRILKEYCSIDGLIHDKPIVIHPFVVDNLGKSEQGEQIDIIFGILSMEQWYVDLDLRRKKIDLTYYTKEFTEY